MKKARQGFVLVLVLVAISLIGTQLILLTAGAKGMLSKSNRISIDACQRNLAASALAWKQLHQHDPAMDANSIVELDTAQIKSGCKQASLKFQTSASGLNIITSCTMGTLNSRRVIKLD